MKQRLTILGSTGSIGTSTLDVVARHPDRYEVFALSAATQVDLMLAQCARFRPRYAVMASSEHARQLDEKIKANGLATQVLQAPEALETIASHEQVDAVMAAIVGAAGLAPCLAAARAGKRLLLANKEALVVGGEVFMKAVRDGGATLLPIDSEHSAIFQSLPEDPATWARRVDHVLLTASGGPFRTRDPATLREVTPEQACAHPNFSMGRKISIDSATMMNKALEVIEARWLFDLAPGQIRVVIHPQQIIHSMVQFRDASIIAQLGTPDMRVPIACGLAWPERVESGAATLDFTQLAALTFEEADARRFPGLHLSWQALAAAPGTTAVLNAANEVAVEAFLQQRIRFDQIHALNLATLEAVQPSNPDTLQALLALDAQTRAAAQGLVQRFN
ncbi:1-deoxy-D-xylulose 5-phosphate reductoisomerase [Alicycliphilus denitrificans]|uniref:1-deoxy-D-xylulose-5-phosphate reductoisomerase n=1 Tax=Alicycliphilus denitrificans TaxID=179636 RepID=UPI000965CF3E|nr:1-deoxy-D-xylulose-5-phosphate reductoisomerase [Alicycliphilus denitrificans]MBN9574089.1 1-deoxy-D-xylulose-5-phosphate reductoisomerase [Alicycliphilus denitrificans]OJW85674.1 MAG: 1-deoxy-D-xylulose-5-phosphate reductoisomerase [Alicycliphilus sp. 69-12]BCN38300.1 1-deoxy-D-xylulose 5-phosphate reductoisomerase [Alicycliphilus denitrificans]